MSASVHINSPRSFSFRAVRECPFCRCKRRFVVRLYEWYEPLSTCTGCGKSWTGGEPHHDTKAMRTKAAQRARKEWSTLGTRKAAVDALCEASGRSACVP